MATGKYLSLEEARQRGLLKRFAKEHPSEGDEQLFDRLLGTMTKTVPATPQTSDAERDGD
jgi:hypothetical protein